MLTENIRIKNLTEISGRWHWDVVTEDYDGEESVSSYHTNKGGEGIYTESDRQLTGNCQFSLSGVARSTMYRRLHRWFSDAE